MMKVLQILHLHFVPVGKVSHKLSSLSLYDRVMRFSASSVSFISVGIRKSEGIILQAQIIILEKHRGLVKPL